MAEMLSEILGRWRIIEMESGNAGEDVSDFQPFIEFDLDGSGELQFGFVQGFIDHRLLERESRQGVEWTWEGTEKIGDVSGRGWAVLQKDHCLRGMFFIHQGEESHFVAKKVGAKKTGAFSKSGALQATPRQRQFLAFIHYYIKLNGQPPAEADMGRHFKVTPPSIHQMVVTLERKGLIERTPGAARSIRLRVPKDQLSELE